MTDSDGFGRNHEGESSSWNPPTEEERRLIEAIIKEKLASQTTLRIENFPLVEGQFSDKPTQRKA